MAQMSEALAESILRGSGITSGEVQQLCHAYIHLQQLRRQADTLAEAARLLVDAQNFTEAQQRVKLLRTREAQYTELADSRRAL